MYGDYLLMIWGRRPDIFTETIASMHPAMALVPLEMFQYK